MDRPAPASPVLATALVDMLKAQGVKRMFGIPGGGSSLQLIEAAGNAGIDFILTRNETSAAIMAAVSGELTGAPGVILTGIGPGATSAVNGIAYASLEKSPVVLFTDGPASSPHQALDQNALYAPITKFQGRITPGDGVDIFRQALEAALTPPWGPVQLDLTSGDAATPVYVAGTARIDVATSQAIEPDVEAALELLGKSSKPVILAGLEARHGQAPKSLLKVAETLGCPVLTAFKAAGVVASSHPLYAGLFTGAVAESKLLHEADLILLYGLDAIEIIPGRWPYEAPVIDLCPALATPLPVDASVRVTGDLAEIAGRLLPSLSASSWTQADIDAHRARIAACFALEGKGHTAQSMIETAAELAPEGTRLCVDAGAHMFSCLARWPTSDPFGVLKSDGLSTMGYALPAAIASSLQEPDRHALAVTGDGGMLMCLGELLTAVEHGCKLTVIVINDASLSLIDIKQHRQQYASAGVAIPGTNFAAMAKTLGLATWRVEQGEDLAKALSAAFASNGPALVDLVCDASGYADQLARIRG